jgi:hypothetical protein
MRQLGKWGITTLVILGFASSARADAVPISFIWGQFLTGPTNLGSGHFHLGSGLIPMMDTPLYGSHLMGLNFSLMTLYGDHGPINVTNPATGEAGFTISGAMGGTAEFNFLGQPIFSEMSSGGYSIEGQIQLVSSTIPGVDLSAFLTGGLLRVEMDSLYDDVTYGPNDFMRSLLGGGARFTLTANGGSGSGQVPEPTTLLALTVLAPTAWWYIRRRRSV